MDINDALKISRDYACRTASESNNLYGYISGLITAVKTGNDKDARESLNSLIELFKPAIFNIIRVMYPKVYGAIEFDDFMQECYCIFISLVYAYDPTISKFPHYIKVMLPKYVSAWSQKTIKKSRNVIPLEDMDIANPYSEDADTAINRLLAHVYYEEYTQFIENYAKKSTKTDTLKAVCYRHFLGQDSCRTIAEDLNISYHAVYDYISKIKKELNYYIKHSPLFDFYFSPDGEIISKD